MYLVGMSDPAYDGLCGVPCPVPQRGGTYLRCRLPFGHGGKGHDWEKHKYGFRICGGTFLRPPKYVPKKK